MVLVDLVDRVYVDIFSDFVIGKWYDNGFINGI